MATTTSKKIRLDVQKTTTTLHVHKAFLNISWPLLHNCDMKLPNLTQKISPTFNKLNEIK